MDLPYIQLLMFLTFVVLGLCAENPKPIEGRLQATTSSILPPPGKPGTVVAPIFYNVPLDAATASQRIDIVQPYHITVPLRYVHPPYTYVPYVWPYYVAPQYVPRVPYVQHPYVYSAPVIYSG